MPETPSGGVESWHEFRRIRVGCTLQRLFSTFPDRGPGFGLLLMRAGIGIALIYLGVSSFMVEISAPVSVVQNVIMAGAGVFLIAGLWTPVMGALAALGQVWIAFSQPGGEWIHIFLAVLSASLAMLGPGIWSIDARLFGRRRFYRGGPPKG
jgi:putative oxidoreductase